MTTADELIDEDGEKLIVIIIARQSVEEGYIAGALEKLHALSDTSARAHANREKVSVLVEGYDSDPRELHEIPEVNTFFRELTQHWPYWLWFLARGGSEVRNLVSYLAGAKRRQTAEGKAEFMIELADVRAVLSQLVRGSDGFFQVHRITEDEQLASINSAIADLGL